jgi:hypothetical protein
VSSTHTSAQHSCPKITVQTSQHDIGDDGVRREPTVLTVKERLIGLIIQMTMPGNLIFESHASYFGHNLTAYVRNGTIPESRVDDMGMSAFHFPKLTSNNAQLHSNSYPRLMVSTPSRLSLLPTGILQLLPARVRRVQRPYRRTRLAFQARARIGCSLYCSPQKQE